MVTIPAGEWITVETNDLEVLITGLESNTTYEYQVRGYCTGEDTSTNWTAMATFTTKVGNEDPIDLAATEISATKATLSWTGYRDSYNVQYRTKATSIISEGSFYEDFESGSLTGWTVIRNGEGKANTDWHVVNSETVFSDGPIPAHSGTNVIMGRSWSSSAYNVDNWIITPQVTLSGKLYYWVKDDGKYHDHYDVYVSTTAPDPDNFDADTFTKIYEPGNASNEWTRHTVDLSSYAGQQGYIAFRHTDNDQNWLFIDDVVIGTIVDVPAGDWVSATTTETTLTVSDLNPETEYEWQVQGIYEGGTTNWVSGDSFTTEELVEIELVNDDSGDGDKKNSEFIANNVGKYCEVTLSDRTLFKDGNWNTICLPFDVDLTAEDCPLDGAIAKTLTDATVTKDESATHIALTFGDAVTTLEAGVPYIIKWAADPDNKDVYEPVFTDVVMKNVPLAYRTLSFAEGKVQFTGYYDAFAITATDDIFYLAADNKLKNGGTGRIMKSCRAYFQFSDDASTAREFVLNFGDGEATGITTTNYTDAAPKADGWYTVDGVKRSVEPTRKGLYIQNGKKVVIK